MLPEGKAYSSINEQRSLLAVDAIAQVMVSSEQQPGWLS
jgi:hypothetical protein